MRFGAPDLEQPPSLPGGPAALSDHLRVSAFICGSCLFLSLSLWRIAAAFSASALPVQLQAPLRGDLARSGEAELGDLVGDALRSATGADIALVAAGELREETLPAGDYPTDAVKRLLESGDEPVTVLSLNGATIHSALEVGVGLYPRKSKGFLQVSGMQYTLDPRRPEGSRIVARTVGGQPMQDGRQYRVAMSSSLASGQYGYYRLWSREKAAAAQGLTMAGALDQSLRTHSALNPHLEGRIVVRPAQ
jgi:5'-nucleotidase / UDP-sugar diphosphatase